MPLKKLFSALLALSLALCLCGCEEEEKNLSMHTYYSSACIVDDAVYILYGNNYLTSKQNQNVQYELTLLAKDSEEETSVNIFPTNVPVAFHPSGSRCLCIKDGRLLSYALPSGETAAICDLPEGADSFFCVTENYALLSGQTLVELNTGTVLQTEQMPEGITVLDILDDCIYYYHAEDGVFSILCYDCAADIVSTACRWEQDRSEKPVEVGKLWGGSFLYCRNSVLCTVPLGDGGKAEPAFSKPTMILGMERHKDDIYVAAVRVAGGVKFFRLTPDGTLTEFAAWEDAEVHGTNINSVDFHVANGLLVCVSPTFGGTCEVFRLPLPEAAPPEETEMLIECLPEEGRALQADYTFPEEVSTGTPDTDSTCLKLAAYPDNSIDLYGVYEADKNEYSLIVTWEDLSRQFDISFLGTGGIDLRSAVWDADGDGADELVLTERVGTGTGVSLANLHVIEKTETSLSLYSLCHDAVSPEIEEWVSGRINAAARTLRVGEERFIIPGHVDSSRFAVGNIVSFEAEDPQIHMSAAIGFWPPDRASHGVSDHIIRLSADVVFSDGTFSLQNFRASEYS